MFRAYDIRGVVGETLTGDVARLIGRAVGSTVRERGLSEVVVGRDGRLSGPDLAAELIKGLRQSGCDVIDIGAVPTPVLYFATYHLNAGSGVMVTGSHNPPEYNGFKIVVGGETLAEDAIQALYQRITDGRFASGTGGLQVMDIADDYVERITGDVQSDRRLKVVVDAGNGIAGAIGPRVLDGIGAEVVPLHCDVDGTFPNHHPDPSDPENLQDLIMSVKRLGADVGLAFDGDGDRLGVVTASGEIIYPDRLLMLFAIDVLNRNPGATVIYDVKCTGHLQDVILRNGGSPVMWKTGHSLIKAKMRESDAELAGEMSGHFFFRERWFGFDDGIYAAARLLEILGGSGRPPQEMFDELPKGVSTPELKITMAEGEHYAFIAKFRDTATFPGARVSNIDGVRADFPDGWGLVRCSNTTPSLVLRFDADSAEALARIQDVFRTQLLAQAPDLKLPF
ncbi:MAG: phosphomannomutase/phosphoglucomutase [Xanthomonadaceae bacterium]|nr:phosphomannomutase/phosphoglucomutase [Xanthomonadaceae bacterium]